MSDVFDLNSLSSLLDAPTNTGKLDLELRYIQEDPEQPRTHFSEEKLNELKASIAVRGVKTPISVREDVKKPGYYIINHGARRFRACQELGRPTIPAIIDNDYLDVDQIMENLHRNDLTAMEIARFIGRKKNQGMKNGQIADLLCVSNAFVTQHVALLNLPPIMSRLMDAGRLTDVTVIYEVTRLLKVDEPEVIEWLSGEDQEFTRGSLSVLKAYLETKQKKPITLNNDEQDLHTAITTNNVKLPEPELKSDATLAELFTKKQEQLTQPVVIRSSKQQPQAGFNAEFVENPANKAVSQHQEDDEIEIWVKYQNSDFKILNKKPSNPAQIWIGNTEQRLEVALSDVQLERISWYE